MAKTKAPKRHKVGNFAMYQAMHGLRGSSAAQKHDTRPNRQRTRADAKRAAIRDY